MDLPPASRDSLRLPAPLRLLIGSFVVALLINLLPWSGLALQVCPDFVLLILLYWAIQEPRSVGQGLGFVLAPLHEQRRAAATGRPVAGVSGTLERRFRGDAASGGGIVRAKTGSLAGVSSLVGMVTTRGGRLLIFAVFAQAASSRGKAEAALDRFAAALAALD